MCPRPSRPSCRGETHRREVRESDQHHAKSNILTSTLVLLSLCRGMGTDWGLHAKWNISTTWITEIAHTTDLRRLPTQISDSCIIELAGNKTRLRCHYTHAYCAENHDHTAWKSVSSEIARKQSLIREILRGSCSSMTFDRLPGALLDSALSQDPRGPSELPQNSKGRWDWKGHGLRSSAFVQAFQCFHLLIHLP
jgi:hypothetical protein